MLSPRLPFHDLGTDSVETQPLDEKTALELAAGHAAAQDPAPPEPAEDEERRALLRAKTLRMGEFSDDEESAQKRAEGGGSSEIQVAESGGAEGGSSEIQVAESGGAEGGSSEIQVAESGSAEDEGSKKIEVAEEVSDEVIAPDDPYFRMLMMSFHLGIHRRCHHLQTRFHW